jgi:hypothetical protein
VGEPGWSGLCAKLAGTLARRSNGALIATLVTGVVRAIWHLPLVIYGHIPWFDILIFSSAFQIMISGFSIEAGGSVLIVMVFISPRTFSPAGSCLPSRVPHGRVITPCVALACVIALVIL